MNSGHVYIDPMMKCLVSRAWRWPEACHMFVDVTTDLEVLHAFAKKIGLRREWFQSGKGRPHYDLNATRRWAAIKAGAVELDRRDAVEILRQWRALPSISSTSPARAGGRGMAS